LFFGIAKFEVGVHQTPAAVALAARKIARGLLDKGYESWIQREIVGEVVEPGGEQHHPALADAFLEQQWRLVA
jgi:hypothetical protein